MNTYVILRRRAWESALELEKAVGRASRVVSQEMADRVRWIRSYVLREADNRLGAICVFQATDSAALIEHARRAGIGCDEIIPAVATVVINDDPVPAADSREPVS